MILRPADNCPQTKYDATNSSNDESLETIPTAHNAK